MSSAIMQSKTMKLKNMPDFPRKIDFQRIASIDDADVIIVAVSWYRDNDWCAYSGLPFPYRKDDSYDCYFPMFQSASGVALNGDKLSEEDAVLLFPEYKDWIYNR